jgi:hypothetical protein
MAICGSFGGAEGTGRKAGNHPIALRGRSRRWQANPTHHQRMTLTCDRVMKQFVPSCWGEQRKHMGMA